MNLHELRKSFREKERALFQDPFKFLLFSIEIILVSLILHRTGYVDLVTFLLVAIWLIFWANSSPLGKTFLLVVSTVGFTHELIGVHFGWFTYATTLPWGVPVYILPGYGCIYWAAHNFWKNTKWLMPKKKLYPITLITLLSFYAVDFLFLNSLFRPALIANTIIIALIAMLIYQLSEAEQNLAYFVLLLTGFNEILGTLIGAWTHYPFSLVSAVPPYVFLVWVCVAITHSVLGDRKISRREILLGILVFLTYSLNLAHIV